CQVGDSSSDHGLF
nr:immunoglobulin light chain junction region [Macaca mulatta]MPN68366.1 immunoglobulin light chain junction region [Macaca mulatta]MPN68896.1 immunoglobulin light chain junction region [Macaca mulatta]